MRLGTDMAQRALDQGAHAILATVGD